MELESEKKAAALVATVGRHAEALRRVLLRHASVRDRAAIRNILEAHEGYVMACENELVQREITKRQDPGKQGA